ncbi:hypothetical protein LTR01_007561 [Friedmanniomyces endolithicus]|nr:hypothetical protein LTR01_007561 [Friedmanniomyces endolithicus]KAK0824723.1 hypothetical protein LTR73_007528 [Friedmanniomyces endolithicus]
MARRKIIIDTDPGVDDILALLLAFASLPEELEVLLISVTYGNIDVQNCLRNVVSLFYHIEQEIAWRERQGRSTGFETLRKTRPLVAVGPDHPLNDQILMADHFRKSKFLHPSMTPDEAWKALFIAEEKAQDPVMAASAFELPQRNTLFDVSHRPSHLEILRLLRESEPDTITIVAIGPLTTLALAAAEDPETFLRVKEVVVMGGTIDQAGNVSPPAHHPWAPEPPYRLIKQAPGPIRDLLNLRNQITPLAEFNTFADAYAAARVYALTSPNPHTTLPPTPPAPPGVDPGSDAPPPFLAPYPEKLSRRLNVTLFPLDITERHLLTRGEYRKVITPLLEAKSPLAEWTEAFLSSTFDKIETLQKDVTGDTVSLQLHDPLCIYYCITSSDSRWKMNKDEDIRIETSGQWTRGMCVVDKRTRKKREDGDVGEQPGDNGNWLSGQAGNRLMRCVGSPGEETFGGYMLKRIFNL